MRNLILLSTAVVLVLVGLYIYLEIDKRRFIESLPQQTPEVLQTLDSTPSGVRMSADVAEQTELETLADALDSSVDTLESFVEDNAGIQEWEAAGEDTVQETEENPLSPEVEGLFSKYYALREKRRVLAAELSPIQLKYISIIHEVTEIMTDEGDISTDGAEEANARIKRGNALAPIMFELQEESERLSEDFKALLGEYGFSSEEEFYQTHREAYKAWQAAQ